MKGENKIMLTHMGKILDEARKGKYGIPAPTIWDERSIRASLEAVSYTHLTLPTN